MFSFQLLRGLYLFVPIDFIDDEESDTRYSDKYLTINIIIIQTCTLLADVVYKKSRDKRNLSTTQINSLMIVITCATSYNTCFITHGIPHTNNK